MVLHQILTISFSFRPIKCTIKYENWVRTLFRAFHTLAVFLIILFGAFSNVFAYFLVFVSGISQALQFAYFTRYRVKAICRYFNENCNVRAQHIINGNKPNLIDENSENAICFSSNDSYFLFLHIIFKVINQNNIIK